MLNRIIGNKDVCWRFAYLVVMGKDVYNQRFFSLINKLNGLIDTAHCDDGQQGPKDLLLHDSGFPRHILQHSGS